MKKYKYLVVNGCSYVQGVGCENAKEDRFSKLLSDKLQCKEINLSKSGGSRRQRGGKRRNRRRRRRSRK